MPPKYKPDRNSAREEYEEQFYGNNSSYRAPMSRVTHSSRRMLGASSTYPRSRGRYGLTTASAPSTGTSNTFLVRPRLPLRSYARPKTAANLSNVDSTNFAGRSKRLKARKLNGYQKLDATSGKKKAPDYTDFAYREAVSKLKYLLAESYTPRITPRKLLHGGGKYNPDSSNPKINIESGEDTDDRGSMVSDVSGLNSKSTGLIGNLPPRSSPYLPRQKTAQLSRGCSNLALLSKDPQSAPPELMSFIDRQEEYIEQLERESQYCRDELTNLLGKVREVVAENETLHDKSKNGFLKSVIEEYNNNSEEENQEPNDQLSSRIMNAVQETGKGKRVKLQKILEGPSIVFESRISELEAQLTQARVELRKVQEENQANMRRLTESGGGEAVPELKAQLERAMRDKRESDMKVEELQRNLSTIRDREADTAHKAKRTLDVLEQAQFEKTQAEAEMRRLKDELDRQHERLREASQDASRRVAEERHQIERRYSQQVEQLSADVASHWDVASKSQLEAEKQRREMSDLRRDLAQKQSLVDELKKELHSKISAIQSDLNQAIAEKDAAEQEVSAAKLSAERTERQARQEQSRLQTEINSYKQRLERADADLVHCRRENLRLSEQIASLEKELNLSKMIKSEEHRTPSITPRAGDNDKELTSMIMDIETKHAATVAGLEDALANQATVVSQLSVECQSLTQRLEANSIKHKEEMASLQNNLKYLTSQIQDTLTHQNEYPSIKSHPADNEIASASENPTTNYKTTNPIRRKIVEAEDPQNLSSFDGLKSATKSFVAPTNAVDPSVAKSVTEIQEHEERAEHEAPEHQEIDRNLNEPSSSSTAAIYPSKSGNDEENREYIRPERTDRDIYDDSYVEKSPMTDQPASIGNEDPRATDISYNDDVINNKQQLGTEENLYEEHGNTEMQQHQEDYNKMENYETENQNYETENQNYGTENQNYETENQNYGTENQNYETENQNYGTENQNYDTENPNYDPRYTDQSYEQDYNNPHQYDDQGRYQGDDDTSQNIAGQYAESGEAYQNMQYNDQEEYERQNYEGGYNADGADQMGDQLQSDYVTETPVSGQPIPDYGESSPTTDQVAREQL